jgi:hypothetical protein
MTNKERAHALCRLTGSISFTEERLERLLNEAEQRGEDKLWEEINQWKPNLHFCPEWDYLLIDKTDVEFECCRCFKHEVQDRG